MVDEPPGSRDASGRLGNKSKGDPQSSQSSETGHVQITDSARNLGAALLQPKPLSQLHSREPSGTTAADHSLRGMISGSSCALPSQGEGGTHSHAASKLMSLAVGPPSEPGDLLLETTPLPPGEGQLPGSRFPSSGLEDAGASGEHHSLHSCPPARINPTAAQEETAVASSRRRDLEVGVEPSQKRPMDDSALEEHSPGDADMLEKLWPLMAAVQRRQSGETPQQGKPSAPSFRLTSAATTSDGRAQKLTRAQAEFLGSGGQRTGGSSGQKPGGTKQPGFFQRHTSSPLLKSSQWDQLDGLRMLDPRKERRMDPQERVRQWLEQGEQYMLGLQSPQPAGLSRKDSSRSRSRSHQAQQKEPQDSAPRKRSFQQWFSCFAF